MMRRFFVGLACLALLVAGMPFVQAQTATTGQIAGTVVDPTGAVVAGAKITLTSDVGVRREAVSDAIGRYSFALLPPGSYTVTVSAPSFGAVTLKDVIVRITEITPLTISLKLAEAKEAVQVTAETPLVNTETAGHGKVIEQGEIRQLPLSTRNFQQLLALTPGASGSIQNSSELGRGDAVVFVNGQRALSNAVVLNGVDANAIGTGSTPNLAVPATDTMREFIVQTSLYDATQGRSSGGVIAAVTKSGENTFHGGAYEFLRNTGLNANNFFFNRQGVKKPTLDRNQFGAYLGGPVKKDRAWFFVSYQGTRETNGASLLNSVSTVFVPGVLTKDRSDAAIAGLYNAYFGATLGPIYYNIYKTSPQVALLKAAAADGNLAIPGWDTSQGTTKPLLFASPSESRFREDQFNTNADIKLSEANRMSVKFFFANNPTHQGLYSFAGVQNPLQVPGFPVDLDINQRLLAVDDTHVISANLINYARFGFSQIAVTGVPAEPVKSADLGMQSPLSAQFPGMPTVSFYNMMDVGTSPLSDQSSTNRSFTVGDMLTWIQGKHTLKIGGEYKHHQSAFIFNAYTRGQMFFTGVLGDPFADFLLGMPAVTIIGSGDPRRDLRAQDLAGYVQDDWRIHPRFTLNLGIRYDFYGGFTDTKGRAVAFDPTLLQTEPVPFGVRITGGFAQAGNGNLSGVPKVEDSLVPADRSNFAPRVGFAWQPLKSDRFVVRGGYGIYYDRANARLYNSQLFNTPYYTIAPSIITTVSYPQMGNPFVQVPAPSSYPLNIATSAPASMMTPIMLKGTSGLFSPVTIPTNIPATGLYPDRHNFRVPYIQQYNLGFQYEFANNWLLDLSYVGSTGRKQYRLVSLNQTIAPGAAYYFQAPLYPGLSAMPLPVFGTFAMQSSSNSNYNSLQASVTKRMGRGLQFLASYTWSKSMDDYSGTDVSDLSVVPGDEKNLDNWALSDFDRRHRVVFSGSYDLPKFYHGTSGVAKRVANGWQVNSILVGQTGLPFTVAGDIGVFAVTRADLKSGTWSPSYCGSGEINDARLTAYFDVTAFKAPTGIGNFGTTRRNMCRGPAQANVDFSVVKFIPVKEGQNIEFRTEFFNLLNNVNFANPVSVSTSRSFGQIARTSTGPRVIQFAFKFTF
ncbi:MAG: TonB-dependent receptor domain-containing protein [Terriglobales bacterium]